MTTDPADTKLPAHLVEHQTEREAWAQATYEALAWEAFNRGGVLYEGQMLELSQVMGILINRNERWRREGLIPK